MRNSVTMTLLLASAFASANTARAQDALGGVIYSRQRDFRVPFNLPPGAETRLKALTLFMSTDQGRTWQAAAKAEANQKNFPFSSDRDGMIWFAVQTNDFEGRLNPSSMQNAPPSLRVVIDTVAPRVSLHPLQPRGSDVGVTWEIVDDNVDMTSPDSARLEYRVGGGRWNVVPIPANATQVYWAPQGAGPIDVRMQVQDKAKNSAEAATSINPNGTPGTPFNDKAASGGVGATPGFNSGPGGFDANGPGPNRSGFNGDTNPAPDRTGQDNPDVERRYVNSKRISLNYDLKDVGPSGVASIELWYTMDRRTWNKYPNTFGGGEAGASSAPISFPVAGEGVYGISLVAKSGVGLGDRPPQIGDLPQLWIEVDLTKPVVQLQSVLVGQGVDKGKLAIGWVAKDKNLGREPITISFAETPTGPWTPIVEKHPNTSRFIWNMPERVPYQFHVKVEAVDLAGNVGEAATESLIKVDLSVPKARILNVEAGK
ncbi:MAG: hypothetical protein K2X38_08030 [Gemmataceae bacterium]|nr:hypothetical protein [Gemmataceae bacterium]